VWVETLKASVRGVRVGEVNEGVVIKAKTLVPMMEQRLEHHIDARVDIRRKYHYSLDFIRDNLASVAAAKCLVGHIVNDLQSFTTNECLLGHPNEHISADSFLPMTKQPEDLPLDSLEGCYLHYDPTKKKWIRSGKASGVGKDACFNGRLDTHAKNSRSIEQMRKSRFYQEYPWGGVPNIGGTGGTFENLRVFCGMAFNRKDDISPLCSVNANNSLFVWSKQTIEELKKKDGNLQDNQLVAISYLWETCDDLLLAREHNVSQSPGCEGLGLRVNN